MGIITTNQQVRLMFSHTRELEGLLINLSSSKKGLKRTTAVQPKESTPGLLRALSCVQQCPLTSPSCYGIHLRTVVTHTKCLFPTDCYGKLSNFGHEPNMFWL